MPKLSNFLISGADISFLSFLFLGCLYYFRFVALILKLFLVTLIQYLEKITTSSTPNINHTSLA